MPQDINDIRREEDNDRRKKRGADSDAAVDSRINRGDLGEAARRAHERASAAAPMESAPQGASESLADYAARKKRERQNAAQGAALAK